MFNHTKDIPFAAAMIAALYFLLRAARAMPRPRRADMLLFGLMLGAALGLRAMGLLLIGYAGFATLLQLRSAASPSLRAGLMFALRSAAALLPALALGYVTMIGSWPWAALDLLNPIRAVFAFAHFHYAIRTLLFGDVFEMGDVPRWYVPAYFLVKLSLPIMAGVMAAGVMMAHSASMGRRPGRTRETVLVAVTAFFPLVCQVVGHGPAFTGLRHYLFVVPSLCVLAGIGLDAVMSHLSARRRLLGTAASGLVVASLGWNAATLVRLHPYEYLFFNPLAGGLEGAARRYDTDYWVNVMAEAVGALEAFVAHGDPAGQQRFRVAVCGERLAFEKEISVRLQWTGDWDRADFYIAPTHMNCDRVLKGLPVATIARLGVPIGVVKDLRGYTAAERWSSAAEIARR
jgi:hypothetical protein